MRANDSVPPTWPESLGYGPPYGPTVGVRQPACWRCGHPTDIQWVACPGCRRVIYEAVERVKADPHVAALPTLARLHVMAQAIPKMPPRAKAKRPTRYRPVHRTFARNGDVARALGVSAATVTRFVHRGMPRVRNGHYDLPSCIVWYRRFKRRVA
jgi:hypothetical protein